MNERLKNIFTGAYYSLRSMAPMLLGVVGLVGLFQTYMTPQMLQSLFSGHTLSDMSIGVVAGGVSVGQPFISYIIGGELLDEGVSMYAVSAFILSFVTLGVVQLPMEWSLFGRRFTLVRNLLALVFAFIVAFLTAFMLQVVS